MGSSNPGPTSDRWSHEIPRERAPCLYVSEFAQSSIGILEISSTGTTCTLTESPNSPIPDNSSSGLLSIQVFPPRPFWCAFRSANPTWFGNAFLVRERFNHYGSQDACIFQAVLLLLLCGALLASSAQMICPLRPNPGSPVLNPPDLFSQNGVVDRQPDSAKPDANDGFMHYCYVYIYQGQTDRGAYAAAQSGRPADPESDRQYSGALRSPRIRTPRSLPWNTCMTCLPDASIPSPPDDPCNGAR